VLGGLVSDLALLSGGLGSTAGMLATAYIENAHLTEGFGGLKSALASIATPTNLLIGGLAGIAVGSALAYSAVKQSELAFDDVSSAIGITIGQLKGLDTLAAGKGIDTSALQDGMNKFGASVYQAQHRVGDLFETFNANNVSAKDFNDYLAKAADLIQNAGTNQQRLQLLQQMGLPATMEWVRFLSEGGDAIKAATGNANAFGDAAEYAMVAKARKFDEEWATTWKNFKSGAQNAVIDAGGYLATLSGLANTALMKIGVNVPANLLQSAMTGGPVAGTALTANSPVDQFYKGTGAGSAAPPPPVVDKNAQLADIARQQQIISLYGSTASAEQAAQQVDLQMQAARVKGISIDADKVTILEQLAREQAIGVTAIKASIDASNVEAGAVGMSVGAAAEYTAAQNALNAARQKGMTLTPQNIAQIQQESSALGLAASNADLMKFAFNDLTQGPMEAFTAQIAQGASAMAALQAAGQSALNAIAKKLADMAAQNLWSAAFGGSSGGGGLLGLLGLGGIGATGAVNANGSIAGAIGATSVGGAPLVFASGGYTGDGGMFEPAGVVHRGEFVMNARATSRIGVANLERLQGYSGGGFVDSVPDRIMRPGYSGGGTNSGGGSSSAPPVIVNINNTNDFRGADPGSEARINQRIDAMGKAAVSQAVQAVASVKATTPSYLRAAR
jgi:hypothetical protein